MKVADEVPVGDGVAVKDGVKVLVEESVIVFVAVPVGDAVGGANVGVIVGVDEKEAVGVLELVFVTVGLTVLEGDAVKV